MTTWLMSMAVVAVLSRPMVWPVSPESSLFMAFLVADDQKRPYTMTASAGRVWQPRPGGCWEWTYRPAAKAREIVAIDLIRPDGDNERFELVLEPLDQRINHPPLFGSLKNP